MKKIGVVLHSEQFVSPFVCNVLEKLNATYVIWIGQSQKSTSLGEQFPEVDQYIYGDTQFMLGENTIVFFDVFLIPTLNAMEFYGRAGAKFAFVQHGLFNDVATPTREKSVRFRWYLSSLTHAWRFLSLNGFSLSNFRLLRKVMNTGSWSAASELRSLVARFDVSIFWAEEDARKLVEAFPDSFPSVLHSASPDREILEMEYSPNGKVLLITQPLVEDSIISHDDYTGFLNTCIERYGERLIVVRHPRLELMAGVGKTLRELDSDIDVSLVIGHYSSLLMSVPNNIEIEYETFGNEAVKKSADLVKQGRRQLKDGNVAFSKALKTICEL